MKLVGYWFWKVRMEEEEEMNPQTWLYPKKLNLKIAYRISRCIKKQKAKYLIQESGGTKTYQYCNQEEVIK